MNICLAIILFFSLPSLTISGFVSLLDFTSNNVDVSKITRGSSLSSNESSPYWLSPSGNIAFGFYQLPWSPNKYTVGIWFIKSSHKTLVWTANHKDLIPAVHKPSSIIFTKEGKLVLRIMPDNKDKLLLSDVAEPVSYAKLHDNGNFVLYGFDSQIVWESFDYPSDTLLGGQKLKLGYDHLISNSGEFKLSMDKSDGVVCIYNAFDKFHAVISSIPSDKPATPPTTLNLDSTGMLYLANRNGAIREIIYKDKNQQRRLDIEELEETSNNVKEDYSYMYRATLDSTGDFILYKERIEGKEESSSSLVLLWASYQWNKSQIFDVSILIFWFCLLIIGIVAYMIDNTEKMKKKE